MNFFKILYPSLIWRIKTSERVLYLTFDDGPHPEITPFVLDLLKQYNAKATFFCIGDNVAKHPDVVRRIISEGHAIGNHTYNHLNGWKTSTEKYLQNTEDCRKLVDSRLFRPPYGRITSKQIQKIKPDYSIVMWDVLTRDWDNKLKAEQCFDQAKKATAGSIIVFHDSEKAKARMKPALQQTLEYFSDKGFTFQSLNLPFEGSRGMLS